MNKLFISHSSEDDAFVRDLRAALADYGQDGWIDSRELRGGDPLWLEIKRAITTASAFVILVSPNALQSKWVGKELRYALDVQKKRGEDSYPVIPLSLNGTKLGVLEEFFAEEPVYIPVTSDAGGVDAAMNAILVAVGERLPVDVAETPQPKAEPLEELVLELTDLGFHEEDGVRRASARARLVYEPATPGQREVSSPQTWRLIAPIGPIEAEEVRWYLEKYAIWPSHYFRDRAGRVEENLVKWGQLLHEAATPVAHTANVMNAWAKIDDRAGRRFSVYVDAALDAGAPDVEVKIAKEVATFLLGLPWELLHDGDDYLFQGAKPTRVRRRLPNTRVFDVPVVTPPIRILLVTARPEDDACTYIDHRASALPLVEAMESLPGLVKLHVLSPPTLPALRKELDRARSGNEPYHVVHFDGHGVYDRQIGLGGLCFELPEDMGKLEKRRHITVFTEDRKASGTGLGTLLRDHRIPLVILEACQTAQAEKASESVASELLRVGVASVVAMSHSVLVETARRFVEAFYQELATGKRVGAAMLAGQRTLKDDTFRGRIFGAGELRLEDWFVPVLYQEKDDPQLFETAPTEQTKEDFRTALAVRLGELPPQPETGFVGRSRELLGLERLLRSEGIARYAVVRGGGGEGKTALAAELARWMVRSHQMHRAAFISVEGLERNLTEFILDRLGHQLVKRGFSTQVDCCGDLEKAEQEVKRVLLEQPTLLVMDNMESILLPPFMAEETQDALAAEMREELEAILALCERLLKVGDTRLVFTSREPLPEPFDAQLSRLELRQLHPDDAVKLVERVLNAAGEDAGEPSNAAREEIERLVEAVHCHARTLALLAPTLRERGVKATRESLVELMAEMEEKFPGSREHSVFASVELSLRRLSKESRRRAQVLGVFCGAVNLDVLRAMNEWEKEDVALLAHELVEVGLATPNRYNHLTLNPALCPYLRSGTDAAQREALTARWVEAMLSYAVFLARQRHRKVDIAATLTALELPNLFALLDLIQSAGDEEATIGLATVLYGLLRYTGRRRLVEIVGKVRDAATVALGKSWNHAAFQAALTRVDERLDGGQLSEASEKAQELLERTRMVGEQAYPGADYDLATACFIQARVLKISGDSEQALPLLVESRQRFEDVAKGRSSRAAEGMVTACLAEQGECLDRLNRFSEAVAAYEESIRRAEQVGNIRGAAVAKANLGTARVSQGRYKEALEAFREARERFSRLDEPASVSTLWHQTGLVYQSAGQPEAAEDAFRKSLAISVQLDDLAGQAATLNQLGILYDNDLGRTEEAVVLLRQAADKFVQVRDVANEGKVRSGIGIRLRNLGRLDEAREEVYRSVECRATFGHAAEPWKSWAVLAAIETDADDPAAAAEAKRKAITCYLAYRRDGGENHTGPGRLVFDMTKKLRDDGQAAAASFLQQLAADPNAARLLPYIRALQAVIAGSRDRTLAEASYLDYTMAAEILFLIETLEESQG